MRPFAWIALVLLAGCLTPGRLSIEADVKGPAAFEAHYTLHVRGDDAEEYNDGLLVLALDGPTTIADRDRVLRPAYRLASRMALWPTEGGPHSLADESPIITYLDGSLLVVRTDCTGPAPTALYECGPPEMSWQMQGAPAPFGYGWSPTLTYRVDGQWVTVDTSLDGERGLPKDALLPTGPQQDATLRFVPGELGLPASFTRTFADGITTLTGSLSFVTWGEALPAIAPWPMPPRPAEGFEGQAFLPGEADEAFGMGVTYREGYEHLLSASETARQASEKACHVRALVYYGGGSRWGADALGQAVGDTDTIAFAIAFVQPDVTSSYEVRYSRDRGFVAQALGQDKTWDDPEGPSNAQTLGCGTRAPVPNLTVNDGLREAWRLGLEPGVPCTVFVLPGRVQRAGQEIAEASGLQIAFPLKRPVSNDAWGEEFEGPFGSVIYDAEDGRLLAVRSTPADLAALDAGTLAERPLPVEQRMLVDNHPFRCVPPDYVEFP